MSAVSESGLVGALLVVLYHKNLALWVGLQWRHLGTLLLLLHR